MEIEPAVVVEDEPIILQEPVREQKPWIPTDLPEHSEMVRHNDSFAAFQSSSRIWN